MSRFEQPLFLRRIHADGTVTWPEGWTEEQKEGYLESMRELQERSKARDRELGRTGSDVQTIVVGEPVPPANSEDVT